MLLRTLAVLLACVLNDACAAESCARPPCTGQPAAGFSARVIAVIDGDTVLVRRRGRLLKIRLAGIDAPEKEQDFGAESRHSLAAMVSGRQVSVSTRAVDKYGRTVALLAIDGLNVNEEQVRRGMAWQYTHHFRDPRYIALQDEARKAHRGLWAQPRPVKPWLWRRQHPLAARPGSARLDAP
jgi:micrococcal nuclease